MGGGAPAGIREGAAQPLWLLCCRHGDPFASADGAAATGGGSILCSGGAVWQEAEMQLSNRDGESLLGTEHAGAGALQGGAQQVGEGDAGIRVPSGSFFWPYASRRLCLGAGPAPSWGNRPLHPPGERIGSFLGKLGKRLHAVHIRNRGHFDSLKTLPLSLACLHPQSLCFADLCSITPRRGRPSLPIVSSDSFCRSPDHCQRQLNARS